MSSSPPSSSATASQATAPAAGPQRRKVVLRDIAESLGVTSMTVSRALRDLPHVGEDLRKRIQKKAKELGYRPDPALTALVQYRRNIAGAPIQAALAWFNPWPDPKFQRTFREFELYWNGAQRSAEKLGFRLEEFTINNGMPPERMAAILRTRNIRGILVSPGPLDHEWSRRFDWSQFSVLGLTKLPDTLPIHSVITHQVSNAMRAVTEIRARGYRRIGLVSWRARAFGAGVFWDQVAHDNKNRVPVLLLSGKTLEADLARFERWWRKHKPDAILTEIPEIPEKLKSMGVRVPQDVGLAALTVLDCPIDAGIYQNPEEIGRVSVLVLASLITDGDFGFPRVKRQIMIEGSWVDGSSLPDRTAVPRSASKGRRSKRNVRS